MISSILGGGMSCRSFFGRVGGKDRRTDMGTFKTAHRGGGDEKRYKVKSHFLAHPYFADFV